MPVHPRSDPEFGVAISGCRIDVVHAVLEQQVEHPVGGTLVDCLERRTAEDDPAELIWPVRPKGRFSIVIRLSSPLLGQSVFAHGAREINSWQPNLCL